MWLGSSLMSCGSCWIADGVEEVCWKGDFLVVFVADCWPRSVVGRLSGKTLSVSDTSTTFMLPGLVLSAAMFRLGFFLTMTSVALLVSDADPLCNGAKGSFQSFLFFEMRSCGLLSSLCFRCSNGDLRVRLA